MWCLRSYLESSTCQSAFLVYTVIIAIKPYCQWMAISTIRSCDHNSYVVRVQICCLSLVKNWWAYRRNVLLQRLHIWIEYTGTWYVRFYILPTHSGRGVYLLTLWCFAVLVSWGPAQSSEEGKVSAARFCKIQTFREPLKRLNSERFLNGSHNRETQCEKGKSWQTFRRLQDLQIFFRNKCNGEVASKRGMLRRVYQFQKCALADSLESWSYSLDRLQ